MLLEDITDLLSFCLNITQLVFEGTYYKQIFATATGSPVSAVIANLVMEDIEHRALTTAPVSHSFWKRFVYAVISAVSENEIVVLLQHLMNSVEPSIQFTVERETNGKLPFLDTCVQRTTDVKVETVVYRKQTHPDNAKPMPRIAFRPIGKHMLYTLYHAVIARKYIWVKQNVRFAHV